MVAAVAQLLGNRVVVLRFRRRHHSLATRRRALQQSPSRAETRAPYGAHQIVLRCCRCTTWLRDQCALRLYEGGRPRLMKCGYPLRRAPGCRRTIEPSETLVVSPDGRHITVESIDTFTLRGIPARIFADDFRTEHAVVVPAESARAAVESSKAAVVGMSIAAILGSTTFAEDNAATFTAATTRFVARLEKTDLTRSALHRNAETLETPKRGCKRRLNKSCRLEQF